MFYHKSPTTLLPSGGFVDPEKIKSQIDELNTVVNTPDLWDNPENARAVLQKKSALEKTLNELMELESEYQTLSELYEIAPDDADVLNAIEKLGDAAHCAKFITLFRDPADGNGAFLFIQAGAGGTEAQDWAQMMSRMYTRWQNVTASQQKSLKNTKVTRQELKILHIAYLGNVHMDG